MSEITSSIQEISTAYPSIPLKYGVERRISKFDEVPDHLPRISLDMVESWNGKVIRNGEEDGELSTGLVEFQEGDVLFNKLRPYLAKGFVGEYRGAASPEFLVLQPMKFQAEYLLYVLLSKEFIDRVDSSTYGAKMPRASWDFIGEITVPCPPEHEQEIIVSYLDDKISHIDSLIEKKRLLCERLEEKNHATIKESIVKGVDFDGEYKNSGVPWLGSIPSHWDVVPLGRLGNVVQGNSFPHKYQGEESGDIPFFKVEDMNSSGNEQFLKRANNYISEDVADELDVTLVPKDAIAFPRVGAALLTNKRRILAQTSVVDDNIYCFVPKNIDRLFAYYVLQTIDLGRFQNAGPVPSISMTEIKQLQIAVPPKEEQRQIRDLLETKSNRTNEIIKQTEQSIQFLQEKRQSLITKAITGQIDLTEGQSHSEQEVIS